MLTGTVHFFDSAKGYGYITPDLRGDDIFVHFTGIKTPGLRTLQVGAKVSHVTVEGRRGKPQAVNVVVEEHS